MIQKKNKNKKLRAEKKSALRNINDELIDLNKEKVIGMKQNIKKNKDIIKKKRKKKKKNNEEELERKRNLIIGIFKKMFILAIGLATTILFIQSPLFSITSVETRNNEKITSQNLISLSQIEIGSNIFSINKKKIKKSICENPYIEDVVITKVLPSTIVINIKERQATFMLEVGAAFAYINNQGYILEINTEKIDVPILYGYITEIDKISPGNRLDIEDLKRLEKVLKIIDSAKNYEIEKTITRIDIENENDYILLLEGEEKKVFIGDGSNINTRMLYLKEILERQKGVKGEIFINKDINSKKAIFREDV